MLLLWIYLIAINLTTFCVRGRDKRQARIDQKHRVPEKKLLYFVAAGGGIGALAGMNFFRHKTIKGSFAWKVYVLILVWVCVALFVNYLLT